MKWQPISEVDLWDRINEGLSAMTGPALTLWKTIRVPPVKWQLTPWGDAGGGFWVVGIIGMRVVWFNDIEDGFNISHYESPGTISEYWCNQDELNHTICQLLGLLQAGTEPPHCGPPQPLAAD
jgi:hypothetical protein